MRFHLGGETSCLPLVNWVRMHLFTVLHALSETLQLLLCTQSNLATLEVVVYLVFVSLQLKILSAAAAIVNVRCV